MQEPEYKEQSLEIRPISGEEIDATLKEKKSIDGYNVGTSLYALGFMAANIAAYTLNLPEHSQSLITLLPELSNLESLPQSNAAHFLLLSFLTVSCLSLNSRTINAPPIRLPENGNSQELNKLIAAAKAIGIDRQTLQINSVVQPLIGLEIFATLAKNLELLNLPPNLYLALIAGSFLVTIATPTITSISSFKNNYKKTPLENYVVELQNRGQRRRKNRK